MRGADIHPLHKAPLNPCLVGNCERVRCMGTLQSLMGGTMASGPLPVYC